MARQSSTIPRPAEDRQRPPAFATTTITTLSQAVHATPLAASAKDLNDQGVGVAREGRLDLAATSFQRAVEISPSELLDRISILEIKREHVLHRGKRRGITAELARLVAARDRAIAREPEWLALALQLKQVNRALWEIEDEIRACQGRGELGPRFVALAQAVCRENDRRCEIKNRINARLGAGRAEEKVYGY
jgi:hypothetical protein